MKSIISVFCELWIAGIFLALPAQAQVMAKNTDKAFGQCLAPVEDGSSAKSILGRNKVSTGGKVNAKQMKSIAMAVQQIELLNGGPSQLIQGAKFKFSHKRKYSNAYMSDETAITMGHNHTDGNVSHIMHELCHHIGNKNGLYAQYKKEVGICKISNNYGNSKLNENFAEACAFMVTNPEKLTAASSPPCAKKAYSFFGKHLKNHRKYAVCDRSMLTAAVRGGNQNGRVQYAELQSGNTIR